MTRRRDRELVPDWLLVALVPGSLTLAALGWHLLDARWSSC